MITIYHNSQCSKSRATLELLLKRNIEPDIVCYLENPPDIFTLRNIVQKLGCSVNQIIRKSESIYEELNIAKMQYRDDELLQLVSEHPILLERPIVVNGDRATIGRPPENVLEIIY